MVRPSTEANFRVRASFDYTAGGNAIRTRHKAAIKQNGAEINLRAACHLVCDMVYGSLKFTVIWVWMATGSPFRT
jgi:hypothetical protein